MRRTHSSSIAVRLRSRRLECQRGVALVYGMIAIAVMMISAAALMRAMDTSSSLAGSAGFRRDLVNATDRGIVVGRDQFTNAASGQLYTTTSRNASVPTANYSATALANNPNGIPLALIDDNQFNLVGKPLEDIPVAGGLTIRYVIDRLCTSAGAPSLTTCVPYTRIGDTKGSVRIQRAGTTDSWVYRLSVRVIGPKNSMTFVQTMIGA